jgi:hypothetical protein
MYKLKVIKKINMKNFIRMPVHNHFEAPNQVMNVSCFKSVVFYISIIY